MKKDFDKWHNKKSEVDEIEKRPFFHEREIWFCHMGINVGFEQDGSGEDFQRPVVIIRKFNNEVCWVVPLSKTVKRGRYYYAFPFDDNIISVAVVSQIRLLDVRRLSRRIGEMKEKDFSQLVNKIKALLP
jgi:mRNA-degrading endonuclease toxin of MazEF toxin-antitoxin module